MSNSNDLSSDLAGTSAPVSSTNLTTPSGVTNSVSATTGTTTTTSAPATVDASHSRCYAIPWISSP